MTNADKIRVMTDEEMVDFLCDMQRRTRYHALTWNEVMEWLQEEAEEGK